MKKSTPGHRKREPGPQGSNPLGFFGESGISDANATEPAAQNFLEDHEEEGGEHYDDDYGNEYDESFDETGEHEFEGSPENEVHEARHVGHADGIFTIFQALGLLLIAFGLGLLAGWSVGGGHAGVRDFFAQMGMAPVDLILVGLLLTGLAGIWRRQRQYERKLREKDSATSEQVETQLRYLVESHAQRPDGNYSSQDLQQVLHLLQRQQEKIGNLSKATKMYGKPLLEITNQLSESGHQISEIGSRLGAVKIILEQSSNRLEMAIRTELSKSTDPTSGLKEATRATRETTKSVKALQREFSKRLTERADKLAADMEHLQKRIEDTHSAVVTGVKTLTAQPGKAGSPDLSDTLEKIQSELTELGSGLANLNTGALLAAAQAGSPGDEAGSSFDGSKTKSVQSAIAKLKEMRQ
jgi:hypothetical protein